LPRICSSGRCRWCLPPNMTMHHQLRHDKRRPMKLPEGIASQMQTEITKVPPKNPASTVYNLYIYNISCKRNDWVCMYTSIHCSQQYYSILFPSIQFKYKAHITIFDVMLIHQSPSCISNFVWSELILCAFSEMSYMSPSPPFPTWQL
jgi:hypothetical protein